MAYRKKRKTVLTSAGCARGLDHVGVVAADLAASLAAWRAIGFAPTPLARHANQSPDGALTPTGTGNHCIMLQQSYLELLGFTDPDAQSATLSRFLAAHAGIHVLTLRIDDAAAAEQRLARTGLPADAISSARPADPHQPDGAMARFVRLPLTDADPRLQLLQHLTPELVWRPDTLRHPNHAVALTAVIVVARLPAEFAARLSRATGCALRPDPAGGYQLDLPQGTVRILPPAALGQVFPGVTPRPATVSIAGVTLTTDDANHAVAGLLPSRLRPAPGGLMLEIDGTAVLFAGG